MDPDTDLIPSSPSNSSLSSSDLDTESTGSFFQERSTSLGTLMGVSIRAPPSPPRRNVAGGGGRRRPAQAQARPSGTRRRAARRRGSGWWRLCRDETAGPSTSLGDLLKMERRVVGADVMASAEFVYGRHVAENGGPRPLFRDGRVLPPPQPPPAAAVERRRRGQQERLPVIMITGICSGDGWIA